MKKLLATTAIALFTATGTAQANTAEEDHDLAIASAYWQTACAVTIVHEPSAIDAVASAYINGCYTDLPTITISADVRGSALCQTIVHEYGHLIGLGHTDGGIMDANALTQPLVPGCVPPKPNHCKSKTYKRNHPNKCRRIS